MPVLLRCLFHHELQRPCAFVLRARVDLDLPGSLHVGLASENENFQLRLSMEGKQKSDQEELFNLHAERVRTTGENSRTGRFQIMN